MDSRNIVVRYIRLYFNNTITKCDWQRYTNSQLLLGEGSKVRTYLLADAVQYFEVFVYGK